MCRVSFVDRNGLGTCTGLITNAELRYRNELQNRSKIEERNFRAGSGLSPLAIMLKICLFTSTALYQEIRSSKLITKE